MCILQHKLEAEATKEKKGKTKERTEKDTESMKDETKQDDERRHDPEDSWRERTTWNGVILIWHQNLYATSDIHLIYIVKPQVISISFT